MMDNLGLSGVFGAEQRCDYLEGPFITFKAILEGRGSAIEKNSFKKISSMGRECGEAPERTRGN